MTSKSTKKFENIDYDIYRSLLSTVEIESVKLNRLNVSNYRDILEHTVDISVKFDSNIYQINKEKLVVLCKFGIRAYESKENSKVEDIFKIKCEFHITYVIESLDTFPQECIEFFVQKNVPINIWPYARELISSITTRMGHSPVVLKPYKSI